MTSPNRIRTLALGAALAWLSLPLVLAAQQGMGRGRQSGQGAGQAKMFLSLLARPKFITMLVIGLVALALLPSKRMKSGVNVPLLLLSTFLYGVAANLFPFAYRSVTQIK